MLSLLKKIVFSSNIWDCKCNVGYFDKNTHKKSTIILLILIYCIMSMNTGRCGTMFRIYRVYLSGEKRTFPG